MKDYLIKYSGAIQTVSGDLERDISFKPEDSTQLIAQLDEMVPKDQLQVCSVGVKDACQRDHYHCHHQLASLLYRTGLLQMFNIVPALCPLVFSFNFYVL